MSSESKPYHSELDEVTDPDTRLVKRSANAGGSRYHKNADGEPACGVKTTNENAHYVPWPPDRARTWRSPCRVCYPPESDEHDEHEYMEDQ